jgi:hypothetical protein
MIGPLGKADDATMETETRRTKRRFFIFAGSLNIDGCLVGGKFCKALHKSVFDVQLFFVKRGCGLKGVFIDSHIHIPSTKRNKLHSHH